MINDKEIFKTFIVIALILLSISIFFDYTVTYTVHKYDNSFFSKVEFNEEMVSFLNDGSFPLMNFLGIFSTFALSIFLYYLIKRTKKLSKPDAIMVMLFISSLLIQAGFHIFGGLSWLL